MRSHTGVRAWQDRVYGNNATGWQTGFMFPEVTRFLPPPTLQSTLIPSVNRASLQGVKAARA